MTVASMAKAVPTSYCLYARKSTEQDERQALSIDSQIKEMLELANREGLHIAEIRRESHSAKASGCRPEYNKLLEDIRGGKFNGILTWAPDRLSRNAGDLGTLVDLMDQQRLVEIRTHGQRFTNSPDQKFLLMILCSQAKLENDHRGLNVKRGLKARVELGLWPQVAPTGYLNEILSNRKGYIIPDPDRAPILKQMFEKVGNDGWSGRKVYLWLKFDLKFKTRFGKFLSLSNIYLLLRNPFYYGQFEYPKGSGRWYIGKHTPIITKDIFLKVQDKLGQEMTPRSYTKEYAFTKLITCGQCGSGITAQEKFKKHKDGTTVKYVYYGCTRAKNLECKAGYIREEGLIKQLVTIIDQADINELGIRKHLAEEIERHRTFQQRVLNIKEKIDVKDVELKSYTKYVLEHSSIIEKRNILSCLKSRLTFNEKIVKLL
jgi:DNA invertase Pin-like site-specific DNA recombinase